MRHQKAGRKLSRTRSHRRAMFRNMLASIFAHEKIETTTPKAKELRPLAEKLITLGKRGDLHARRQVLSLIPDRKVVHKLFEEIAPRFQNRQGGYTRIVRSGFRAGDNAPLSIIELLPEDVQPKKKKAKKKAEPKAKPEVKQEAAETAPEPEVEAGLAPTEESTPATEEPAEETAAETVSDEGVKAEAEAAETKQEAPEEQEAEAPSEEKAEEPSGAKSEEASAEDKTEKNN